MRVSHRLFLAVLPAVLGVLLVAALAYWGQYRRSAPEWLIVVAAATALGSLVIAWRNTRYVAERVERLAGHAQQGRSRSPRISIDELDSLAKTMDRLNAEVAAAREESRRQEAVAAQRVQEYAALLAECASAVGRQLDEVRLPLHILLENHFGSLNENQEEMLGAARQAADVAGLELQRLQEIASIDQGALSLRREQVQVADLLRGLLPILKAEGERRGVRLVLDIAPGLPRTIGDRVRLQEAIELLLRYIVRHADPDQPISIKAESDGHAWIVIDIEHGTAAALGPEVALARRVIAAHGGELQLSPVRSQILLGSAAGDAAPGRRSAY